MTVDILSSIKGAQPSEAVSKLFEVIKNANKTSMIRVRNHVSEMKKSVIKTHPTTNRNVIIIIL